MQLHELEQAEKMLDIADPRVDPGGPMVRYLGPQLSLEDITSAYERRCDGLGEASPKALRAIRSFPVPGLAGVVVYCRPAEFAGEVRALFARHLSEVPGSPVLGRPVAGLGLVEKYHLLDGAYVAPYDETTRQTMVLELGGIVAGPDGPLARGAPFPEQVVVTVTDAHWANVAGLGVGVGFYM